MKMIIFWIAGEDFKVNTTIIAVEKKKNLSGWKRTWKKSHAWLGTFAMTGRNALSIELIKPTGERAILRVPNIPADGGNQDMNFFISGSFSTVKVVYSLYLLYIERIIFSFIHINCLYFLSKVCYARYNMRHINAINLFTVVLSKSTEDSEELAFAILHYRFSSLSWRLMILCNFALFVFLPTTTATLSSSHNSRLHYFDKYFYKNEPFTNEGKERR